MNSLEVSRTQYLHFTKVQVTDWSAGDFPSSLAKLRQVGSWPSALHGPTLLSGSINSGATGIDSSVVQDLPSVHEALGLISKEEREKGERKKRRKRGNSDASNINHSVGERPPDLQALIAIPRSVAATAVPLPNPMTPVL